MPNYEYQCQACGLVFEQLHTIAERLKPETDPCPECQATAVKKVILSAPGIADPVRIGIRRPDEGFKEVMQKIHEKTPGSKLKDNSRYL